MFTGDVLVIGAGLSGLTTAVCLAEAGHRVRVVAANPPSMTTSAVAGASWGPYMVSDDRIMEWSRLTRFVLQDIARTPGTGIRMVNGLETEVEDVDAPSWAKEVDDFRMCTADELPPRTLGPAYKVGWRYTIPIGDTPTYLTYLSERFARRGAGITFGVVVTSLADLAGTADVIVNCTGLGARDLVPDDEMYPTRGQLVVVENNGVDWFFQDNVEGQDLTYFLPHGDHVVLGGQKIEYASHMEPDPVTTAAIVARCAEIEPKIGAAKIIMSRVGLRPMRSVVRTERDDIGDQVVIHNYGHGGGGFTLSWGCAQEVLRLVQAA